MSARDGVEGKERAMMTKEEMRVAIAEKCEWKPTKGDEECRKAWLQTTGEDLGDSCGMPNYPESLDSMHEAEKVLSDEQAEEYCNMLGYNFPLDIKIAQFNKWRPTHATAAQRAEAFCRVFWPKRFE